MLYIGIDLGTSAVKLLLMDENGKIHRVVSKEYPLYFPRPGWSEQAPADWYGQAMAGMKELLADADRSQVAGISFGGQMHGLVILDSEDQVIRPAILWNDGRAATESDYLNQVTGKEKLSEYTANIAFAGFTAPKLLWVKNNEPEHFTRIHKIMLPKDYLAYRLTGIHASDVSDASGMLLLDVQNRRWSPEMCDICGINMEMLPRLFESYEAIGPVLPDIAAELGIPASVKVAAGAKSALWKKMIANILNLKVDVVAHEEGPALGAAMLAAVACGEYADVEEAAAMIVRVTDTIEPESELVARYEARYRQFKEIYPACKPVFDIIKGYTQT